MKLLNVVIWLIAIIILTAIQIEVRDYFDFYAGSWFVSFLIGGWIGMFCYPLLGINFGRKAE